MYYYIQVSYTENKFFCKLAKSSEQKIILTFVQVKFQD